MLKLENEKLMLRVNIIFSTGKQINNNNYKILLIRILPNIDIISLINIFRKRV